MAVLAALQHGVCVAHANGQRVRHLVLTDAKGTLNFKTFYEAFTKKLVPRLRRAGYLGEYAVALEVQPESKRLHAHCLLVEPAGTNGFMPKEWLDATTSECGFGWAWINEVRDIPGVASSLAEYFTKGLGGASSVPSKSVGRIGSYMAKAHEMAALAGLADVRLRPFRVSRGWPIGLKAAGEQLREEMYGCASDPGPWAVVSERRCREFLEPLREQQRVQAHRQHVVEQFARIEALFALAGS